MRSPDELEREIVARKLAEEALQKANAQLEQRVEERTGDLTQAVSALRDEREKLKKAEQTLKEADSHKEQLQALLRLLHHALALVSNSLKLLKRCNGNGELMEQSLAMLERQTGQMVRLIDDLLDISRISRNMLALRKDRVDLAQILRHAVEACRPLAQAANHELDVRLPPEPVYLNADSARLAQVFGNVLTNACKYTEPGGRISLTAERQDGEVAVKVRDTGVGIPPEMLPEVFKMFTQFKPTLEWSQGGLGIGLSLVKRLVGMHDGTVTAHSDGQGHGSEFVVCLPIDVEGKKARQPSEPACANLPTTSRRILIVEDHQDAALSLSKLLKLAGNQVQIAHDGLAAVAAAGEFEPDVILLDIGLPKLNGYAVCRAVREQPWGKDIAIVALTGRGQPDDRRKSQEAGFDGHLVKPIDIRALTNLLDRLERAPL